MANRNKNPAKLSWFAGASALASLIACYGTLALLSVLSMLGIGLAVNEHVWAGVIVAFAVLAVLGITLGFSRHRNQNPSRLAIVGAALVIWAMYGAQNVREMLGIPSFIVELAGFAALLGAAWLDWKLQKSAD